MLSGDFAVLQAPKFDCLSFDPFSPLNDFGCPAEVGVGRRDVVEALVIAAMIIMFDEGFDLAFKIARKEVVLQQDAVLERLMPALDLALGLWMKRCAADMAHTVGVDPFGEFGGNVRGSVVAEQLRLVQHPGAVAA